MTISRCCLEKLIGTNSRTISRASCQQIDLRRSIPGVKLAKEACKDMACHEFFLGIYQSAAEPLPHEKYMVRGSVDKNIEVSEVSFHRGPRVLESEQMDDDDSDDDGDTWNPDKSIVSRFASFLGPDHGVQRRYLTRASLRSLYFMMVATLNDQDESEDKMPSLRTIYRTWATSGRRFLRFRKESQHAECKECFAYREKMNKKAVPVASRIDLAREWRLHLRATYHDRLIYWWCRYASRHSMDVLTIIIDSMDKAKLAWPQYPWAVKDKALDGIRRPRLVLTGAIAHGYTTHLYLAHENLSHGASAFCDVLSRLMESVWAVCQAKGQASPKHLVVQSDNTTAQAKIRMWPCTWPTWSRSTSLLLRICSFCPSATRMRT